MGKKAEILLLQETLKNFLLGQRSDFAVVSKITSLQSSAVMGSASQRPEHRASQREGAPPRKRGPGLGAGASQSDWAPYGPAAGGLEGRHPPAYFHWDTPHGCTCRAPQGVQGVWKPETAVV